MLNKSINKMKKALNRPCPICKSGSGLIIHNQRFYVEKGNPLPDNYDVICCSQCSFVFADVACDQEVYDQYYKIFSKYEDETTGSGSGEKAFEYDRLNETCQFLMRFVDDKSVRVLDIGSAGGGLLKILGGNGYSNLFALEPSQACVDRINDFQDIRINAFSGSVFDDLDRVLSGEKFELIILSHVFEHIYDLSKAMEGIRSVMADNGLLYIEVPNLLKYSEFEKTPFYYFDCEHINHFDKRSISNLCGVFGFDEVRVGEKAMRVSDKEYYPALYGLFRFSDESYKSVLKYVESSNQKSDYVCLNSLIDRQVPVVVWGAGSFTKRLLATTKLLKCNIKYFVDGDKNKIGNELCGLYVKTPDSLSEFDGVVIIASVLFSDDIISEIKKRGLNNELVVLNS